MIVHLVLESVLSDVHKLMDLAAYLSQDSKHRTIRMNTCDTYTTIWKPNFRRFDGPKLFAGVEDSKHGVAIHYNRGRIKPN